MRGGLAPGLVIGVCLAACAVGCLSTGAPEPPPTALELRGFQTREYDTTNTRLVMKAMLNVLQDMGFIVNTADTNLGLLTAGKWTDVAHSKKEVRRAVKKEQAISKTVVLECTANVSEFGKQSRVRVNFQQRVLDASGATMEARPLTDAAFYQSFFSQVDKGIFLQQEGV
jgi:hypothetical protein